MQGKRPISPHLSIYKPQITSVLSISHRATGVINLSAFIFLFAWVVSLATDSRSCYDFMILILSSWFGAFLKIVWSFSLSYHFCNGIRHLFWDIGKGFDIGVVRKTGYLVLFFTLIMGFLAMSLLFLDF